MSTVLGIFNDQQNAEDVINELETRGYNPKEMSIVMRNSADAKNMAENTGADVAEGAVSGATTGAIVGGLAGLLGAFVLPGLGAFLIGGPIAAALGLTGAAASTISGVATGAVAGGLLGALMGFGLPKEEAEVYERHINEGGILVAVPASSKQSREVKGLFEEYDAQQVRVLASSTAASTDIRVQPDMTSDQSEYIPR